MKLSQATRALSQILQNTVEGTATGGNNSTLIDTARYEVEDYFDRGTIWFLSAQLNYISAVITDWNATTKTFTFTSQIGPVTAGQSYAAAGPDYPRWLLIQKINEALRELTPPGENTTLTTVADQESYTLPSGVYKVLKVEIATQLTDPYDYQVHHHWNETPSKLYFDEGFEPIETGYKIRLTYTTLPTELTTDLSEISDRVPINNLLWKAAAGCLRWRVTNTRDDEPDKLRLLNEALNNALKNANAFPAPTLGKDMHFSRW